MSMSGAATVGAMAAGVGAAAAGVWEKAGGCQADRKGPSIVLAVCCMHVQGHRALSGGPWGPGTGCRMCDAAGALRHGGLSEQANARTGIGKHWDLNAAVLRQGEVVSEVVLRASQGTRPLRQMQEAVCCCRRPV